MNETRRQMLVGMATLGNNKGMMTNNDDVEQTLNRPGRASKNEAVKVSLRVNQHVEETSRISSYYQVSIYTEIWIYTIITADDNGVIGWT